MFNRSMVLLLIALLATGTVMAKKGRKLSRGAYITTAKIEILSGDTARLHTAIAALDSLHMNHGPDPEAYYWSSKIMVDFSNARTDAEAKTASIEAMMAYTDSLKWACDKDNKEVDKKQKKECKDLIAEVDSTNVTLWRQFFNDAIGRINDIDELTGAVRAESDSSIRASYQADIERHADSAKFLMNLALLIDPADARGARAMASIYEKTGHFDSAITYLEMALPNSEDLAEYLNINQSVAYNYIQLNDYASAAPWFKKYIDTVLTIEGFMDQPANQEAVKTTFVNLAACLNNSKQYDAAYEEQMRLLEIDPTNIDALTGAGRYHRQMAINASDSANAHREAGDEAGKTAWIETRDQLFDSSIVYLKKASELKPDDPELLDEYALLLVIRGRYEEGKEAFQKLTALSPENADAWTSLGDCNIQLTDYQGAVVAYEKVIELEPENKQVLERLVDLYSAPEARDNARKAEIEQMLQNL